ncbi:MAG: universal stress protein Usp [uncultured bacterium]|nr:MAG: universal stress protein Usp [uncultured bacterium]
MGTHGRSGWSHIRLGSVAEQIIRFSPSPVLICRGAFKWPPQRILVPVDVKEPMDESLFMASALTLEEKGNVELYNVITLTQYAAAGADSLIAPVDVTPIHDKITTQLKDLTLPYFETKFDVAVGEGQVANEICRRAEQIAADFIIIPTHGRKGLTRFLMGSVAEQVIRYATCSVLSFCPQKWATEQREMVKSILRDERTGFSEDTELGVVD